MLADTTYGRWGRLAALMEVQRLILRLAFSCCVDEVAAQHVDADFVVHYGHTCLSP